MRGSDNASGSGAVVNRAMMSIFGGIKGLPLLGSVVKGAQEEVAKGARKKAVSNLLGGQRTEQSLAALNETIADTYRGTDMLQFSGEISMAIRAVMRNGSEGFSGKIKR